MQSLVPSRVQHCNHTSHIRAGKCKHALCSLKLGEAHFGFLQICRTPNVKKRRRCDCCLPHLVAAEVSRLCNTDSVCLQVDRRTRVLELLPVYLASTNRYVKCSMELTAYRIFKVGRHIQRISLTPVAMRSDTISPHTDNRSNQMRSDCSSRNRKALR